MNRRDIFRLFLGGLAGTKIFSKFDADTPTYEIFKDADGYSSFPTYSSEGEQHGWQSYIVISRGEFRTFVAFDPTITTSEQAIQQARRFE